MTGDCTPAVSCPFSLGLLWPSQGHPLFFLFPPSPPEPFQTKLSHHSETCHKAQRECSAGLRSCLLRATLPHQAGSSVSLPSTEKTGGVLKNTLPPTYRNICWGHLPRGSQLDRLEVGPSMPEQRTNQARL